MLKFTGNSNQLKAKAHELAKILTGEADDPHGIMTAFYTAIGLAALADIRHAYVIKARGGTDAMGVTWPPLQPSTIANRKVGKADLKIKSIAEREKIRKREEKKLLKRFMLSMPKGLAKIRAARVAQLRATKITGKTKVETLGSRNVEILRDTDRLYASLTPGVTIGIGESYNPPPDQIFKINQGKFTVGSNVRYAGAHQNGNPKKNLPARKIVPDEETGVPQEWWDNWLDAGTLALEAGAAIYFSQAG